MKIALTTPDTLTLPLSSLAETQALAARLAAAVQPGDTLALSGDLGSGKTAFARAFIQALLGPEAEVPSPTFTLVQTYDAPGFPVWHFDLYRLKTPGDVYELGFEEALAGVSLIEWPDRIERLLPRDTLRLTLKPGPTPDSRQAELVGGGRWQDVLARLRG